MRNLFFVTVFIFQCAAAFPQFRVHNNGNVSIGMKTGLPQSRFTLAGVGDSTYNFYLKDSKSGIFSQTTGGSGTWLYGANMSSVVNQSSKMFVGVSGNAVSQNQAEKSAGRAFGVMGTAGNATSGWNYGVFGRIVGNHNGAAIYGTTDGSENGHELPERYAGYFRGKVSVKGDMTVRGFIDGMLLGPSLDEYEPLGIKPLNTNRNAASVSDEISTLTAIFGDVPIPNEEEITQDSASFYDKYDGTTMERQYAQKRHYALSVDEVEAAYPDLVYTKDDGTKVINYIEMIPLLVESIKELKAQIATLRGGNGSSVMAAPAGGSSVGSAGTSGIGRAVSASVPSLSQNDPNPFVDVTAVKMTIPQSAATALLCIYDMSGKQIRSEVIADRGDVTVTVASDGLGAGMYLYSLIVDGKLVNTRKMILTK